MGYSCTAKAAFVRDAITKLCADAGATGSNSLPENKGFWETGREQADGAITGTVWKMVGADRAAKAGSFKITADGKIARFPMLPAVVKTMAEDLGAKRFAEAYPTFAEVQ